MRTIDLESLLIFRTVVEEGGVVRAASKLHRVPSNVTTRIRQLEEYLAVQLFRCEGRTLALTTEGHTAELRAPVAASGRRSGKQMQTGKPQGTFRLGSGKHRGQPFSADTVALSRATSGCDCRTDDWNHRRAHQARHAVEIEAAFVSEPYTAPELESIPIFQEKLVLITSNKISRLHSPSDLGGSTMIAFAQGCSYRQCLENWLSNHNVIPQRVLEFASYQGMIACVAAGTGFAIVPVSVLSALQANEKVNQHALPKQVSSNKTHLVWRGQASSALTAFIKMLKTKK
jgi:DNA-binding transcriptional LysR family regulator